MLTDIADQLDTAPVYYPRELSPVLLADSMTATLLEPDWLTTTDTTTNADLYADIARTGGVAALPTLSAGRRTVLLGNPGSGKTTILAALTAHRIRTEHRAPTLYLRLPDLADTLTTGRAKTLDQALTYLTVAIATGYRGTISDELMHTISDAIRTNPHTLLALDAWDEVYQPEQREHIRTILGLLETVPASIVITSRITGYTRPFENQTEYLTDDLTPAQTDTFFTHWFTHRPGSGHQRVIDARRDSREVRDLVAIPLMAGLVAFVAEHNPVPTRKHALYRSYITRFLERPWKPAAQQRRDPLLIAQLEATATQLAWAMATTPTASPLGRWHDTATVAQLLDRIPSQHQTNLAELLHKDGLLTLHGRPSPNSTSLEHHYRWLHRTIHEHLTGRYLAQLHTSDPRRADHLTRIAALRPEWSTVLEHTIGLLDDDTQTRVLGQLDTYAAEGDPGNHISEKVVALTVASVGRRHPRAQQTLDSELAQHHYRNAYRIDPDITVDHLITHPSTDWEKAAEIVRAIDEVTTKKQCELLVTIVRRVEKYGAYLEDAFALLAHYDRAKTDQLILEHIVRHMNYISYPTAGCGDDLIDALEEIVATRSDYVQCIAASAILDANRPDSVARVERSMNPAVYRLFSLEQRDPERKLNDETADYRNFPGAMEVLNGSHGAILALRGGGRCLHPLDADSDVDEVARLGYWMFQSGWHTPPRDPSGTWTIERALTSLAIDDLASPPDAIEPLTEANRAMCWLINHQTPEAVPSLIRLHTAYEQTTWWRRVDAIEDLPAACSITPTYAKAVSRLEWPSIWREAEPTVRTYGWDSVYLFAQSDQLRCSSDAIHDIATYISQHNIVPTEQYLVRLLESDVTGLTDIAARAPWPDARKAIVDMAYNACSPDYLEENWPHMLKALNNPSQHTP
ncbi:NACHT domain-containing NTPase [Nocardia sp. 852002-20019_SCH5090214]|uniref:NACHT domain-containing protein n=1 Tax=Nocardia sp. 852002-20019_SCH5090214 TaxID=1834087 RepID=UPI0012EA2903|nr:hypothetical protein [Nocardia sp. 852002-20019_SCH5090214]